MNFIPDFSELTNSSYLKKIAELSFDSINDLSGSLLFLKDYYNDIYNNNLSNDIDILIKYFDNPLYSNIKNIFENNNWCYTYNGLQIVGSNVPNEIHPLYCNALFKIYGEIAYKNINEKKIINIII